MIRMLIVGYYFGIRSDRRLCEEVHLNLAYRWLCRLALEDAIPAIRRSRRTVTANSATTTPCGSYLNHPWSEEDMPSNLALWSWATVVQPN